MEWVFYFGIIMCLIDVESKLSKIINSNNNIKKNTFILENYIDKKVSINIDNDEIMNAHLFSPSSDTIGEIIDYDNEWFLYRYYDKSTKQTIEQYIRIGDITSIDEIK